MPSTSRHQLQFCPVCVSKINSATNVNNENLPKDGDLSICFVCGEFLVFDNGLQIRSMTKEELDVLKITDFEIYEQLQELANEIENKRPNN